MKIKLNLSIVVSFLLLFVFCNASNAEIYRVYFDAFTTNYNPPAEQEMCFWVEVFDTEKKNPPEFVDSITITAPDGTVLNMDPVNNWLPFDDGYWAKLFAADYVVPFKGGNYKCEVVGKAGIKITKPDYVNGSFLPTPSITNLSDGAVDVSLTPTIRWGRVVGAKRYRILLWDETWNEPRYWFWKKVLFTDTPKWEFPPGVLQLGHNYSIRIEARAGQQDTDKRSRSDWVFFTTTSNP